jgi:nucleotide-binding universal stress UspA family protein
MYKIMVPVNGSDHSLKAVDEAIRTATQYHDAVVHIVNVQPLFPRHVSRFLSRGQTEGLRVVRAKQAIEEATAKARAAGLRWSAHMLRGSIAPSLAAYAAETKIDQIVVSTPRLSGLQRLFKHSIADRLIEQCSVPVDVVSSGKASAFDRFGLPGLGLGIAAAWWASE